MAQSDLRRVGRACERLDAARKELRDSIRDAAASGETYRDIAVWARMSHQRVAQIVKEESDAPKTDRPTPGGS